MEPVVKKRVELTVSTPSAVTAPEEAGPIWDARKHGEGVDVEAEDTVRLGWQAHPFQKVGPRQVARQAIGQGRRLMYGEGGVGLHRYHHGRSSGH